MATKPDTKKHLEAILGHKLSDDEVQLIQLVLPVASHTVTTDENTFTTLRNLFFPRPNECRPARLLDISGLATTDNNGQRVFKLSEFICHSSPPAANRFQQPINVVATPRSITPCFLTVTHSLVNTDALKAVDVEIKVFTWDANGAPAPNVTFDWRCRVDIPNIIL
ncbi:MAG: hypothetical protein AABO41_28635 [Acidobacteriota bacterium]